MSFERLAERGDGDASLVWYLYPNTEGDEDEARVEIRSATTEFADQLYEADAIGRYEINLYEGFPECETGEGDDADTYMYAFYDWVDENFGDYAGVHLGVTDHTKFANGESVVPGESAFRACTKAFVGTKGGYADTPEDESRYQNLAIQEPGHNVIVSEYHDLDDGSDHDLGEVKSSGTSTPMITFYENDDVHPSRSADRSGKGECDAGGTWDGTHVRTVTQCTVDAVAATADEEVADSTEKDTETITEADTGTTTEATTEEDTETTTEADSETATRVDTETTTEGDA